ncbi:MAG TPA: hypothetical protein VLI90_17395 [Tepidisphaeraceae bacterium]|nr:hypothetical protein [Tepidisphaeraceae bacterium]
MDIVDFLELRFLGEDRSLDLHVLSDFFFEAIGKLAERLADAGAQLTDRFDDAFRRQRIGGDDGFANGLGLDLVFGLGLGVAAVFDFLQRLRVGFQRLLTGRSGGTLSGSRFVALFGGFLSHGGSLSQSRKFDKRGVRSEQTRGIKLACARGAARNRPTSWPAVQ